MLALLTLGALLPFQATALPPQAPATPTRAALSSEPIDGFVETSLTVYSMAQDSERIFLGGRFFVAGTGISSLVSFDPSTGDLGRSLPRMRGIIHAIESDGAGGVFVSGNLNVEAIGTRYLFRMRADGSLDTSLPNIPRAYSMALDSTTGTLYLAGAIFQALPPSNRWGGLAIDVATGDITSWDPQLGLNQRYPAKVELAGGRVWIGGSDMGDTVGSTYNLVSTDPVTGALDSADYGLDGAVRDLVSVGSRLFVGGGFSAAGGAVREGLAAFDATTGALDPLDARFTGGPSFGIGRVAGIAVDAGTLFAVGTFTSAGGQLRDGAASVDLATGAVLPWTVQSSPASRNIRAVATVPGGVMVAGSFEGVEGVTRPGLAVVDRLTGAHFGAPLHMRQWTGNGLYFDGLVVSGGEVFAAGNAALKGPLGGRLMVAIDRRTSQVDADWVFPESWSSVGVLEVGPDAIYAAGQSSGTARANSLVALDRATGEALPGFQFDSNAVDAFNIRDMVIGEDALYLVLTAYGSPATTRFKVVAVDLQTGEQLTSFFLGEAPGTAEAITMGQLGATLYVGGEFDAIGSQQVPRSGLAALDAATGAVLPWAPQGALSVRDLAFQPGVVYVTGRPDAALGAQRGRGFAFHAQTGALLPWNPPLTTTANMAVGAGQVLLLSDAGQAPVQSAPAAMIVDLRLGDRIDWNPGIVGQCLAALWVEGRPIIAGDFREASTWIREFVAAFPFAK